MIQYETIAVEMTDDFEQRSYLAGLKTMFGAVNGKLIFLIVITLYIFFPAVHAYIPSVQVKSVNIRAIV